MVNRRSNVTLCFCEIVMTFAVVASASQVAHAIPTAFYNPVFGDIRLQNDTHFVLDSLALISRSRSLVTDPSAVLEIPGALRSPELPDGIVYFSLPIGIFDIGNVVTPGTSADDLFVEYYLFQSSAATGLVVVVAEPSNGVLGIAAVFAGCLLIRPYF